MPFVLSTFQLCTFAFRFLFIPLFVLFPSFRLSATLGAASAASLLIMIHNTSLNFCLPAWVPELCADASFLSSPVLTLGRVTRGCWI